MPAQTILYLGDRFHVSNTTPIVHSVSSTANGYNREFVRDTSWTGAWKPNDGVADEYIQIDGGSAGWLSPTGGDLIYVAIAYDARGCDQTNIEIRVDAADAAGGAFATNKDTFTLNDTGPTVDVVDFLNSASGRRYYRLSQFNAARGGGTKTVPIYSIAFFTATEVYIIVTDYPGHEVGAGAIEQVSQVGVMDTAGGLTHSNRNGSTYQRFPLTFTPAHVTLYQALRDALYAQDGPNRCFWAQYEGLRNHAKPNFQMVRQVGMSWSAHREYPDQYDTVIQLRSEPAPV